MFLTDFIFRQQENLVDNQKCQAGFRPLCNKIPLLFVKFKNFVTCTEFIYQNGQISPGPDLPTPVSLHCMITLPSDKVMILGGYAVPAAETPKKVIVFDLKTKNYTVLPSMNYNRMNAGCAIFQSAYHENRTVMWSLQLEDGRLQQLKFMTFQRQIHHGQKVRFFSSI